MVPVWVAAGCRVVVPDLVGFGRSDKPKKASAHPAAWHRQVVLELAERLDLRQVVLVLQGAGGILGLPLAAGDAVRGWVAVDATLGRAGACWAGAAALPAAWAQASAAEVLALLDDREPVPDDPAWTAPFPDRGHRAGPVALAALRSGDVAAPALRGASPTCWLTCAPEDAAALAQHILALIR